MPLVAGDVNRDGNARSGDYVRHDDRSLSQTHMPECQIMSPAAMSSSWLALMIMLSPTAKILCLLFRFKELL
jgi:hypothetical protein